MHPSVKLLLHVLAATFLTSNVLQLRPTRGEGAAGASCIPHERDALLAFKHGISSDPMDLLASWQKDGDCCRWRGIRCSNRTGHVLKLQLRNVNVTSSNLYSDEDEVSILFATDDVSILLRNTALVGQISHSLLSLNKLVHLDLSMNNLTGSSDHIPDFLGSLVNLIYLNLSGIPFSGRVPPHLGNLSKLKFLDLSLLGFWGQPYSTDISWLAGLSLLEYLDMSMVNLSTIVDWPHVVNMIPSMKVLRLSSCSLLSANQSLPRINLTNLEVFDLSDNIFDHPIASSWVWNLTSLQHLYLAENDMYGKVPEALGMLAKLTVLDLSSTNINGDITEKHFLRLAKLKTLGLSGNSLKIKVSSEWRPPFSLQEAYLAGCQMGPLFPAYLQFQVNLTWVDISSTGLIDKLPDWFTTTFSKVTDLSISHNQIYGRLPKNMEYMSLENVHLSSNNFTGQIPSLPRNLISLDLSFNSLSGNLPSELGTPELQLLNLFSNHITGGFSGICELQMLSALDLGNNNLEGELPHQCFPDFLEYLLLSNNNFFGDFPPFLQNRMQLQFLDLSGNKFSGTLPQWIGGLVGLWFLRLSQNVFYGNIPTTITNLTHLRHLNLASNRLSGVIPWDLSRLTAMMAKYTDSSDPPLGYSEFESQDYFSAVTKGKELYYDITIF